MNIDVRAVHCDLSESDKAYLDKKLERIAYAKDFIIDLLFSFTKDKKFQAECTINFKWGASAHVKAEAFELNASIDKLIDVLEQKVNKEKTKVQKKNK